MRRFSGPYRKTDSNIELIFYLLYLPNHPDPIHKH